MSVGPIGYLYFWSTGKPVRVQGGGHNPRNDTNLILHHEKDSTACEFRFLAVKGAGHYGYIEHVASGKVVVPKGGGAHPKDTTYLVLHSDRTAGALFSFDEERDEILHKWQERDKIVIKRWHPKYGRPNPGDDTPLEIHSHENNIARFYFGNSDGDKISPYPTPNITGDWELLRAVITPKADHTYTIRYKVGKSTTKSVVLNNAWKISAEVAKDFVKASVKVQVEYSGFYEVTNTDTWSEEKEDTYELAVPKGQSVWVWQYVFRLRQGYDDVLVFQSNIVGDTDSKHKKPEIAT